MTAVLAPEPSDPLTRLPAPPTFTIVIPTYQAAATVGAAVESALAQVHPALEVVVVDDGSTDDVEGALRPVRERVKLIRKENGGGASALNAGAEAASGDFLAILDADDAYDPRRLEAIAQLAAERPDLDLITTDARFIVDGEEAGRFSDYNRFSVDDQRVAILESCFVGGWPAIRLSRLREIGGFDERLRTGYDWDCWLRLILTGGQAGLVTEAYYDYRLHSASLTASRSSTLWDRVRLLEKARREPRLSARERDVLRRSVRTHRTRAVQAEIEAGLAGIAPRRRLLRHSLAPGIGSRVRVRAALAAAAPGLAKRLVVPEPGPEERLRARA
jgi:glycosyltransferase involved in cell wall biosynthesis